MEGIERGLKRGVYRGVQKGGSGDPPGDPPVPGVVPGSPRGCTFRRVFNNSPSRDKLNFGFFAIFGKNQGFWHTPPQH